MTVRTLAGNDAPAYQALRLTALNERPPAFGSLPGDEPPIEQLRTRLQPTDDRIFLGAIDSDKLVGIARLSRYSGANEKHRAYLAGLYVLPTFRGRGHGRALVQAAIDHASADSKIQRLNLTVVTEQTPAIKLYESLGFAVCGTDPQAFSCDGRFYDEHLMTLVLNR